MRRTVNDQHFILTMRAGDSLRKRIESKKYLVWSVSALYTDLQLTSCSTMVRLACSSCDVRSAIWELRSASSSRRAALVSRRSASISVSWRSAPSSRTRRSLTRSLPVARIEANPVTFCARRAVHALLTQSSISHFISLREALP